MDVLEITPPFFYSYQCGSSLLTSYIPVLMYSSCLQIFFTVVTFVFIIFPTTTSIQYPRWVLKSFPGVYWPFFWKNTDHSQMTVEKGAVPIRFINPHRIISRLMNNFVLLLTFGLCSPLLCFTISINICVHLCSWLFLIGRFVFIRIDSLAASSDSTLGCIPSPPFSLI